MAEKKKWIRDRGLIEIEGKEFPPMLSALVQVKKNYFSTQSYVRIDILSRKMQDEIRKLLRIENAQKAWPMCARWKAAVKAIKRKNKVRS